MAEKSAESTDYLVIGAGSAGCAAARVLVQNSDATVTVLESGGTNDRADVRSLTGGRSVRDSGAAWPYYTVPQRGTDDRVHLLDMGRVVGGSSSVNGMMYMRGATWDFDAWEALGNEGWGSDKVYETYRKLEDNPEGDPEVYGVGGPLKLSQVLPTHPLTQAFLAACAERGYQPTKDFNGPDPQGYGTHLLNVENGVRMDAGTAFLSPLAGNPNLRLELGATATQLNFDPTNQRVESVTYLQDGRRHTIKVNNEVLLCAGAIASPQLLLVSGVGPADELEELGIDVRVALNGVGKNLHDHVGVMIAYEAAKPFPPTAYQYLEVGVYLKSDPSLEHYDMQMPMRQTSDYIPTTEYKPEYGYTFFGGLLQPRSRGSLTLKSSDARESPLIDIGYLTDDYDLERMVTIVEVARDIGTATPFDEWRAREFAPGLEVQTRKQIEAYVRSGAWTYYHPVGTCKMGSDADAVVDAELKVHGVANLRVADASIMPNITSGNTNAPAMMIGWRGAEFALRA
jgi:choline dehydrogenase